jgi:hypothetical protein
VRALGSWGGCWHDKPSGNESWTCLYRSLGLLTTVVYNSYSCVASSVLSLQYKRTAAQHLSTVVSCVLCPAPMILITNVHR